MANILVVDDSTISRTKLKSILEAGNHTVVGEAKDGIEALEKYKELKPDLVTLDVTMPNMDGLQCLKKLFEIDEDATVIMISALGKGDTILQSLNAGAVNFISKPFDEEIVLKAIVESLEI